jgi:hypothetical protein
VPKAAEMINLDFGNAILYFLLILQPLRVLYVAGVKRMAGFPWQTGFKIA